MWRITLRAAFLALASSAIASAATLGPLITNQPVPWRGGAVKPGDAEAQVRKVAGQYPDSAQPLYVGEQYPIGERWMFVGDADDRRVLWVEFTRGRVTRVWAEPIEQSMKLGAPPASPR